MRSQYPPRGRRCGTLLIAAALLVACAAAADSLRAQSERLDRNQQAFPAAPAAGTGTLARPVRDALASVVPSLQQRRFPSDAVLPQSSVGVQSLTHLHARVWAVI